MVIAPSFYAPNGADNVNLTPTFSLAGPRPLGKILPGLFSLLPGLDLLVKFNPVFSLSDGARPFGKILPVLFSLAGARPFGKIQPGLFSL